MGNKVPSAVKKGMHLKDAPKRNDTFSRDANPKNVLNRSKNPSIEDQHVTPPDFVVPGTAVDRILYRDASPEDYIDVHSKDESLIGAMNKMNIIQEDNQRYTPRYTSTKEEQANYFGVEKQSEKVVMGMKTWQITDLLNGKDIEIEGITEEDKKVIKMYIRMPNQINLESEVPKKDPTE